jgi:hypothetical protein
MKPRDLHVRIKQAGYRTLVNFAAMVNRTRYYTAKANPEKIYTEYELERL